MLYNLTYYFLLFIMYAFMGWFMEVIVTLFEDKKLIDRGFLIGPICPIYGVGLLLITSLLKNYVNAPLVLFILTIFICMTLEYFTSYVMEKLFNARWWDYSNRKFNLNGRICLETTIPFGIGGLAVMYLIHPFFTSLLNKINTEVIVIVGIMLLIIFLIDLGISFSVITKIKHYFVKKEQDDTEEINKRIRNYLLNLSPLTKRLMESFPDVRIKISNIKDKIETTVKSKKKVKNNKNT